MNNTPFLLNATTVLASPKLEGALASVSFFGNGEYSMFGICRTVTDPLEKIEVHIGSEELIGSTDQISISINRQVAHFKFDRDLSDQLDGFTEATIHFDIHDGDLGNLIESLRAIVADKHGSLQVL